MIDEKIAFEFFKIVQGINKVKVIAQCSTTRSVRFEPCGTNRAARLRSG